MARYDARLTRLERMANAGTVLQEGHVTFTLTECLERAIRAAESETGLQILEVDPLTLSGAGGRALADSLLESGMEIIS